MTICPHCAAGAALAATATYPLARGYIANAMRHFRALIKHNRNQSTIGTVKEA